MSKFSKIAAVIAAAPILAFSAPVFADSPGSFSTGDGMYQVRNESQKQTAYQDSVAAACGETVKYAILLSNTANGAISNITVKTSLTDGTMTATGSTGTGTTTTSGKATVSLPSGANLQYVAGSTQEIDYNTHAVIGTLADGITANGTTIASLAGSTNAWVEYEAKVNCPTPTKVEVCNLQTKVKETITQDELNANPSKYTTDLTKCNATTVTPPTKPTTLVNTGAGNVAAVFAGVAVVAGLAYNLVLRRNVR